MFAAISIATSLFASVVLADAFCSERKFENESYAVCEVDPSTADLRLWLNTPDGDRIGTFTRLKSLVEDGGGTLVLATNAGMYHPDRFPVGLYIEDGRELASIVTREGPGNFGLLPNGVLCLNDGSAQIFESRNFKETSATCRYATQSGPMLVIDGALHPRFLPESTSLNIRNGVGVREDGVLLLAISNAAVNFDTFARFFRDVLKTPQALFLDGRVSRLYAPELGRSDFGLPLGPMIGVSTHDHQD